MSNFAWVTLATNDSYSLGALVVAHSLKRVHTAHQLAVLITPGVSEAMKTKLRAVFNVVEEVNLLDSKDEANLALLKRPELGITFTKLHCWRLVQFEKCVFLDADTLVLRNCDELFEREELSAAPDVGWPDCFNSGVYVYRPSMDTFSSLLEFAVQHGSFDGGDQGLLNSYFSDWATKDISRHLPFVYNTSSVASYSYLPAFKQFGQNTKILHFIGTAKPWLQNFNSETRTVHTPGGFQHLANFLQYWWDIFCEDIHSRLSSEMSGLAGALSQLHLGEPKSVEQEAYEEHMRRQCWEQGNIDYMGRDSFENIWRRIQQTLGMLPDQTAAASEPEPAPVPTASVSVPVSPSPHRRRSSKSRSRSATPKRDPRDRSPTPPPEDKVPVEKKEVLIEATIHEEDDGLDATSLNERSVRCSKLPPPVQYDPTTRATTLTKKVFAGYQQVITTKSPEGKTRTQTKTVYDPSVDDDEPGSDAVDAPIRVATATVVQSEPRLIEVQEPAIVPVKLLDPVIEPLKPVELKPEAVSVPEQEAKSAPPPLRAERKPSPPRRSQKPQMQQVAQESMAGKEPNVEPPKTVRRKRLTSPPASPQTPSPKTVQPPPSPKTATVTPKTPSVKKPSSSTKSKQSAATTTTTPKSTTNHTSPSKSASSTTTNATIRQSLPTALSKNHQKIPKTLEELEAVPLTASDELPAVPPRRKRESKVARIATVKKKSTLMNLFFSCITCTKRKDVK
ncbi:glycogenin-2 isoform X7 [Topomyia yanbarensis]|uniref:glycogenin-2 isoform X7 n=1 Tax=Topomyia yanbarensis TaxID=2498891 RepID=UPI00273AE32B|nr:glycogenin-2 isoform X7 [Topomyia yanbarensis]